MEVPENVLNELKCDNCESYLSCGPVYQMYSGQIICGRCTEPEEPSFRNRKYETVAKLLRFPCKHRDDGCREQVSFSLQGQPHEAECSFRPYVCPVAGPDSCDWLGNRSQLLEHCRETHPECVVQSPHALHHDIIRDSQSTFLFVMGHLLFLLHAKVCIASRKILHAVRYLGHVNRSADFTYSLIATRGKKSISLSETVAPEGCRAIQGDISISLDINSLLTILGGFDGTSFTITLEGTEQEQTQRNPVLKCIRGCGRDVEIFVYRTTEGWYCEECAPPQRACRNSTRGCNYKDFPKKCRKHEKYYCTYQNSTSNFWICNGGITNSCKTIVRQGRFYEHFTKKHGAGTYDSGDVWRCSAIFSTHYIIIKYDEGIAFCCCDIVSGIFYLDISTEIPGAHLHAHTCIVERINPCTKQSETFVATHDYDSIRDWSLEIKNCTEATDIKITIKKE